MEFYFIGFRGEKVTMLSVYLLALWNALQRWRNILLPCFYFDTHRQDFPFFACLKKKKNETDVSAPSHQTNNLSTIPHVCMKCILSTLLWVSEPSLLTCLHVFPACLALPSSLPAPQHSPSSSIPAGIWSGADRLETSDRAVVSRPWATWAGGVKVLSWHREVWKLV